MPQASPSPITHPAISKITTTPLKKRGRKSDERRSNSGFMLSDSYWRVAALEKRPELSADPYDDHHHRRVEDQQQRISRAFARERGDIGERAQQLRRADEARDRSTLGRV